MQLEISHGFTEALFVITFYDSEGLELREYTKYRSRQPQLSG